MPAPAHHAHLAASRARVLVINGKYESFRELYVILGHFRVVTEQKSFNFHLKTK